MNKIFIYIFLITTDINIVIIYQSLWSSQSSIPYKIYINLLSVFDIFWTSPISKSGSNPSTVLKDCADLFNSIN